MSSDLQKLDALITEQCIPEVTPHAFNLVHQIRVVAKKNGATAQILHEIVPTYLQLAKAASAFEFQDLLSETKSAVAALEGYLAVLRKKENDKFVSQSDF